MKNLQIPTQHLSHTAKESQLILVVTPLLSEARGWVLLDGRLEVTCQAPKPVWASPYPQQQGSVPSYQLKGRHTRAVFASIKEARKQEAAKAG